MKRICCLCERWESGGIESFLHSVLMRLDLVQIQVDVVAASLGKSIFTKPLQMRGVCFFELSGSLRHIAENHRQFCKLLRERQWDVVHLNAYQGLSLHYLHFAKEAGVPVRIAHSHNTALRKSLTRPLKLAVHRWTRNRYTRDATNLWACSHDAAEFLFSKKILKTKGFQFIPNGIDAERFRFNSNVRDEMRAELGLKDEFVVGNVGRLCYQKNQEFLLDVFAKILRKRPDSRLLLVGEGENLPALREKATRLGIAEKIIFYGISDHVERLLWAMDVFAFPSRFEGLGIVAVEAQAAGLPIAASEFVPEEACVTPLFQRLQLCAAPDQWANTLLTLRPEKDRTFYAEKVKHTEFDISDVVQQIEVCFLNLER